MINECLYISILTQHVNFIRMNPPVTNKFYTIFCFLNFTLLPCDSVTVSSLPSLPWLTMSNETHQMSAVITVTRASSHSAQNDKTTNPKDFSQEYQRFLVSSPLQIIFIFRFKFRDKRSGYCSGRYLIFSLSAGRDVWRLSVRSDCLDKCINFPIPDTPGFVSSHFTDFPISVISVTFYHLYQLWSDLTKADIWQRILMKQKDGS